MYFEYGMHVNLREPEVDRIVVPQDVHILIPGTCEYAV